MRTSRRVIAAGLVCAALALSACGGQEAGSAATIGDSRITEQQLAAEVQAVLVAQQQAPDTPDAQLTSQTLGQMIGLSLMNTLAEREGIEISQARIDEQIALYIEQTGDRAGMEATFATQAGVAPAQIESIIRFQLQLADLGQKLAPTGTDEERSLAVLAAATALSNELDVQVSPRFGTWDPASLTVGPVPDDLSTLPIAPLTS